MVIPLFYFIPSAMVSLHLREPLLSRNLTNITNGFSMDTIAKANIQVKELMLESPRASVAMILDQLGYLRMGAYPDPVKQGGNHVFTLINVNNKTLSVARFKRKTLKNWAGVAARAFLPPFALFSWKLDKDKMGESCY